MEYIISVFPGCKFLAELWLREPERRHQCHDAAGARTARSFGALILALKPTTDENQYKIKKFFNLTTTSSYPWYYLFSPDDDLLDSRYPLPNRILLETHFHIANVLHGTGRGELVEQLQRDFDEMATRPVQSDDLGELR